jgi:histidinol-phosphate aminotransferase
MNQTDTLHPVVGKRLVGCPSRRRPVAPDVEGAAHEPVNHVRMQEGRDGPQASGFGNYGIEKMMTSAPNPDDSIPAVRPELVGREPYGAPQVDVPVRLNTNENPHGPDPALIRAIVEATATAVASANRYPDRDALDLRQALAAYLSEHTGVPIDYDSVWAANGSNEALDQLMRAFAGTGRAVLGFEPTYSMHRILAETSGALYVGVPRDDHFNVDRDAALRTIVQTKPDVVVICSPNNPTGGSTSLELISEIYDASAGLVLIDEAYAEFSAQPFALAGVRLGYLAADPRIIQAMLLVRLPYHLSSVTQAVARAALAHRKTLLASVHDVSTQRDRILAELSAMGMRVAPSDANFVLFRPGRDASVVWQHLLDKGVLVRNPGLDGYLRVTAGTESETNRFLKALKEIS